MKRPRMSTGAWIFAGLVSAAVIAPATVYAATTSRVAIGTTNNSNTANVTSQHQLLTTIVAPQQVIHIDASSNSGTCQTVYTPPAGKGIDVTSVTYDLGVGGSGGDQSNAALTNAACTFAYDFARTSQTWDSTYHSFPLGLPMPKLVLDSNAAGVTVTGYLIPANQVGSVTPASRAVQNMLLHK